MFNLNRSKTDEFLDRFYHFNDAVIRKVEVLYTSDGKRNISIRIATRDVRETQNDGWVCVHILISQVGDFSISESANSSAQVVSQGVHVVWQNENVGFDFGYFADPPESIDELKSSNFFMVGLSVEWVVEPYYICQK